jgi:hypothetical protein
VLIHAPRYEVPLSVSKAVVRWSTEQEGGLEFMQMASDDERRLLELFRAIKATRLTT